jgi:hypothetical protein
LEYVLHSNDGTAMGLFRADHEPAPFICSTQHDGGSGPNPLRFRKGLETFMQNVPVFQTQDKHSTRSGFRISHFVVTDLLEPGICIRATIEKPFMTVNDLLGGLGLNSWLHRNRPNDGFLPASKPAGLYPSYIGTECRMSEFLRHSLFDIRYSAVLFTVLPILRTAVIDGFSPGIKAAWLCPSYQTGVGSLEELKDCGEPCTFPRSL